MAETTVNPRLPNDEALISVAALSVWETVRLLAVEPLVKVPAPPSNVSDPPLAIVNDRFPLFAHVHDLTFTAELSVRLAFPETTVSFTPGNVPVDQFAATDELPEFHVTVAWANACWADAMNPSATKAARMKDGLGTGQRNFMATYRSVPGRNRPEIFLSGKMV